MILSTTSTIAYTYESYIKHDARLWFMGNSLNLSFSQNRESLEKGKWHGWSHPHLKKNMGIWEEKQWPTIYIYI